MAPKKSTKGGEKSISTPPSRKNTRSSNAMTEPPPPTQTELQEIEAPLDVVQEQEIQVPPSTTMIEEVTKRMQQHMRKNLAMRQLQMQKCDICGGDHPTPWCTQQLKAPVVNERVLKWCAIEQKWTNHVTEECFYKKNYVRERPYGSPVGPSQPPPPRYQVGPNANVVAGLDIPQPVLGQQPHLPHENRAMIKYAQPYEALQVMNNAPLITYYEEPNEPYIMEPEPLIMPHQKQAKHWAKGPYEVDELLTHEKSHMSDDVLAQIPTHIFIAKFKDDEADSIKTTIMPREIWMLHRKSEVVNARSGAINNPCSRANRTATQSPGKQVNKQNQTPIDLDSNISTEASANQRINTPLETIVEDNYSDLSSKLSNFEMASSSTKVNFDLGPGHEVVLMNPSIVDKWEMIGTKEKVDVDPEEAPPALNKPNLKLQIVNDMTRVNTGLGAIHVTREALYLVDNCKAYGEVNEDADSIASGASSVKSEPSTKKDAPAMPTTEKMIEEIAKWI
ncbi:hypothetical protein L7F22_034056 [Adiantum nelumboides]|nr:hypothetical protein [Adiantum nelumboides]